MILTKSEIHDILVFLFKKTFLKKIDQVCHGIHFFVKFTVITASHAHIKKSLFIAILKAVKFYSP